MTSTQPFNVAAGKGAVNTKCKEGGWCISKFVEQLKPRRWIFVPTRSSDAKAANSLCAITNQSHSSIECIFQCAGAFTRCIDERGEACSKITESKETSDQILKRKRQHSRWKTETKTALDGKAIQALFIVRGEARGRDLVPCIAPPPVDGDNTLLESPVPNIKLSEATG